MLPPALSRRNLIAAVIGAGAAWLSGQASYLAACGDRVHSKSRNVDLAALCSDLRCPETIRKACLRALPAAEVSRENLSRLVLADLSSAAEGWTSAIALKHSVRERSRDDFREGRIVIVDGWMLSLTETRVYALAALLALQLVNGAVFATETGQARP
jgi:hypothetical protein